MHGWQHRAQAAWWGLPIWAVTYGSPSVTSMWDERAIAAARRAAVLNLANMSEDQLLMRLSIMMHGRQGADLPTQQATDEQTQLAAADRRAPSAAAQAAAAARLDELLEAAAATEQQHAQAETLATLRAEVTSVKLARETVIQALNAGCDLHTAAGKPVQGLRDLDGMGLPLVKKVLPTRSTRSMSTWLRPGCSLRLMRRQRLRLRRQRLRQRLRGSRASGDAGGRPAMLPAMRTRRRRCPRRASAAPPSPLLRPQPSPRSLLDSPQPSSSACDAPWLAGGWRRPCKRMPRSKRPWRCKKTHRGELHTYAYACR